MPFLGFQRAICRLQRLRLNLRRIIRRNRAAGYACWHPVYRRNLSNTGPRQGHMRLAVETDRVAPNFKFSVVEGWRVVGYLSSPFHKYGNQNFIKLREFLIGHLPFDDLETRWILRQMANDQ